MAPRHMRLRQTIAICAATLAALLVARVATAGSGLLVGVADDSMKWPGQSVPFAGVARSLGLNAVRVTLRWQPGQSTPSVQDDVQLQAALAGAGGARVVVAVYGNATDAPQDNTARAAYCSDVAGVLTTFPQVRDVVIWNEPNNQTFWQPQDGAAGAYEALLAQCWDVLHAVSPDVNVIAASAPRGTTRPGPWYQALGAAYRASGRTRPIFDTVGHNAYPDTSTELPTAQHSSSDSIGEGDYATLMQVLNDAFRGTGQPTPGHLGVTIWYLEDGFQTSIDPSKASLYSGQENVPVVDPRTQATQLTTALELAYCQPAVGGFFNFELVDETDLAGWQSGVLWADGTPKPSFAALASAIAAVRSGHVDCSTVSQPPASAAPTPAPAPASSSPSSSKGGSSSASKSGSSTSSTSGGSSGNGSTTATVTITVKPAH